jgi:hypothetical protein
MSKVFTLTIRNRAAAIGFSIAVLVLGVIFVTLGMALLAGVALTGAVIGGGLALSRRLRGKAHPLSHQPLSSGDRLDPSLEIQPTRPPTIAPLRSPDK